MKRLAEVWGAEAMVDHSYLIMQPSSGEPVYLRFIEDEGEDELQTYGNTWMEFDKYC